MQRVFGRLPSKLTVSKYLLEHTPDGAVEIIHHPRPAVGDGRSYLQIYNKPYSCANCIGASLASVVRPSIHQSNSRLASSVPAVRASGQLSVCSDSIALPRYR